MAVFLGLLLCSSSFSLSNVTVSLYLANCIIAWWSTLQPTVSLAWYANWGLVPTFLFLRTHPLFFSFPISSNLLILSYSVDAMPICFRTVSLSPFSLSRDCRTKEHSDIQDGCCRQRRGEVASLLVEMLLLTLRVASRSWFCSLKKFPSFIIHQECRIAKTFFLSCLRHLIIFLFLIFLLLLCQPSPLTGFFEALTAIPWNANVWWRWLELVFLWLKLEKLINALFVF